MRNLETILVNSYPSKSIVGRSGAGRSVGEVVDREDDAEAVDRREVLRDLGVVMESGLRRGVIAEAIAHDANRSAFGRSSRETCILKKGCQEFQPGLEPRT